MRGRLRQIQLLHHLDNPPDDGFRRDAEQEIRNAAVFRVYAQ